MRSWCTAAVAGLLGCALAAGAGAQASADAPYPKTGVDYSGIDQFYKIADILAKDDKPSNTQWSALLNTPGYRLVEIDNEGIRDRIELALKPSLKSKRDAILARDGDQARVLRHLIRAVAERQQVLAARDQLARTMRDSIATALPRTARYLPKGTIERFPTPFIGFAVFSDDGYAEEPGILLDPLYIHDHGAVEILSHEMHHSYTALIDRVKKESDFTTRPPDVGLFFAVMHLRNEGIADQVDKTYPLPPDPTMEWYPTGYNSAYAKTPAVLHTLDSLLTVAVNQPSALGAAGTRANQILWSNGHPNGAYMAREIVQTFGIDSLMPGVYNPVAFFRTYAAAEIKLGNPPPFSAQSMRELALLERHFINRP
ncbi:MAG: DUF5700 domain-containing putative Zn-dependent protease [Gemmatimonadaceae bacterium]